LPIEGGVEAAYKADLQASSDPQALMSDIVQRIERLRSPLRTAEAFRVEEIIDPRDTRPLLVDFAHLAARLREPGPSTAWCRP
jgi:acetyl-CoA carboxylase carboxyltransferase component